MYSSSSEGEFEGRRKDEAWKVWKILEVHVCSPGFLQVHMDSSLNSACLKQIYYDHYPLRLRNQRQEAKETSFLSPPTLLNFPIISLNSWLIGLLAHFQLQEIEV